MAKSSKEDISFEKGLSRLEELIQELESGESELDHSLKLFEEGVKLSRGLNRKLDEVDKKLEILLKDENGELSAKEFRLEAEGEE